MGIPTNIIIMWSGAINEIPSGWFLCNGSNGTPNLVNRFVVGSGSKYLLDQNGGNKDAVNIEHTHTATIQTTNNHQHSPINTGFNNNPPGTLDRFRTFGFANSSSVYASNSAGAHSHTASITAAGGSGTDKNLPPYYALAYIMYGGN